MFAKGFPSDEQEFVRRKGTLRILEKSLVDSTSRTKIFDLWLINDLSDTVRARVKIPLEEMRKFPVALLVVGIETGKDVVNMIEGYDSVIVVGVDYPFEGVFDFAGWNAVKTSYAFREMAFRTIPQLLLCLDWISMQPQVDTTNITMVAVSFGVFTAVPAAAIDRRVDKLVVVQAGGDIAKVLDANAERLGFPVPSWLAGWIGQIIFSPFEPNRYIGLLSPRPVLIISGNADSFFPPESVQSLFDQAADPKEWIRHQSKHVAPNERELILELTQIVGRKLYGSQ